MPQTRDTVVPIRLNDDEALALDTARRALGQTRASYLRQAMLEKIARDKATRHKPK